VLLPVATACRCTDCQQSQDTSECGSDLPAHYALAWNQYMLAFTRQVGQLHARCIFTQPHTQTPSTTRVVAGCQLLQPSPALKQPAAGLLPLTVQAGMQSTQTFIALWMAADRLLHHCSHFGCSLALTQPAASLLLLFKSCSSQPVQASSTIHKDVQSPSAIQVALAGCCLSTDQA
jgi:hypothetical protein